MPAKITKMSLGKKSVAIPQAAPALSSALPHHSHWRGEWLWMLVPAFLAAIGWWTGLERLLEPTLRPDQLGQSLSLAAGSIVAFALMTGIILLVPNIVHYRWVYPAMGLLLGLPAMFFFGWTAASGIAALIVATGLWAAAEGAGRETLMRIRLDIRTTLSHVVPWVVLATSFSVALLQYDIVRRSGEAQEQADHVIDLVVRSVEKIGPKFIEGFNPSVSVDQLLGTKIPSANDLVNEIVTSGRLTNDERSQLQEKLSNLGLTDVSLPAVGTTQETVRQALGRELDRARNQIIAELRETVSKQLGVTLKGDETVHQALVTVVEERTGVRSGAIANFLPPIFSIGLFLALRLLSPLFSLAAVVAGWFWYRALRLAHVIHVDKTPVMAERLRWGGN